jgi:hypothetical protein
VALLEAGDLGFESHQQFSGKSGRQGCSAAGGGWM